MDPVSVAVIGLGRMGGPLADHVIAAGHHVRVFDVAPAALAARVARGAVAAASPADAARGASSVHIIVFDDAQALDVVDGPEGVLRALAPGAVVSIHSTVTLDTIRRLASAAEAHGVTVLDAGISGGETGAAAGTLVTMVGGPDDAVARVRPVLASFSKEVVHAGPLGAGMALKLARNTAGYVMMAAVHEAMELAHRAGVDVALLQHVIAETAVAAQALSPFAFGGPEPLPADATEARAAMGHVLHLAEKDLDQALALATHLGAALPVSEATRRSAHHIMRL